MNNLQTYDQYNEGLFSSKYKNTVDRIYNYISRMDLDDIVEGRYHGNKSYNITIIKNNKNKDKDPYGEEEWEEDENIAITLALKDNDNDLIFRAYDHILLINDDEVDVKRTEAKKLFNLVENRIKNRKEDEKRNRINAVINRI